MGSNTEKKPWTNLQNSYKNWSKVIKSDNFCYRKVGRAITKWGAIEKSPILLSQYWKNYHFQRVTNIISYFGVSNNIFADCKCTIITKTPKLDNRNISQQLFDYTITFKKSQPQNTNSKIDFVLKNWF